MKVHLIRSKELDIALFTEITGLLKAITGPIEFIYDSLDTIDYNQEDLKPRVYATEEEFTSAYLHETTSLYLKSYPLEQSFISWKKLFEECNAYRSRNKISKEDFVFLLTELPNEKNWFAALDDNNLLNGFIHADDWEEYIDCPPQFPIAYEVIALILHHYSLNNNYELQNLTHQKAIGCVNDFCLNKREVILKLRTADICNICLKKIKENLPFLIIHHALSLLESLRLKMLFSQNFKQEAPLSKLYIDEKYRIFLSDFENIEIKLTPLEKSLFLLFLCYPKGILLSQLSEYRNELYGIYMSLSNMGDLNEMKTRIDEMSSALSSSASQKISKIKKTFETAIGTELAKNYYIKGVNGEEKGISLDRTLVCFHKSLPIHG